MQVLSVATTISNCLEALSYEEIWHNTLQSHISDAIVFVSPENVPISFNTKMNDMLEPKQQAAERQRSRSERFSSIKLNSSNLNHLLSSFDPKFVRLVHLFEYFNSSESIRYHNVDFTKIMVKSKRVFEEASAK